MDSAAVARHRPTFAVLALSDTWLLGVLVALSAFARFVLTALPIRTPYYLPDEYTYSAIARGIAETGRPVIRESPAHFPALLEPLLAAPFWLTHNPELAFRLTQAEHSIVMSLGAIPIYLLCRRLGLTSRTALAAAVLALVSPDLILGSLVVSEPIAYPLVLTALFAAVVALDSPSRRAQLAVVGLVGLATFARVQYALLVPVFVVAAVVVARGNLRRAWSTFGIASSAFGLLALAGVALGPSRVLGAYSHAFALHASATTFAHQLGTHLLLMPVAAGVVLVPGALVGLALGAVRPRSSVESAFATITILLAAGLVAQAVFVAGTVSGNFGERYVFFVFPLLTPAFALYARREGSSRIPATIVAVVIAGLAIRVPLSPYLRHSSDSATLWALERLSWSTGIGTAALVASLVTVALAAVGGWVAWRPQSRTTIALALVIVAQSVVAVGAAADAATTSRLARTALPRDASWVDDAQVGRVTLVGLPGNNAGAGVEEALWNSSITSVVRLRGATRFDPGQVLDGHVTTAGSFVTSVGPVDGPVLVDRIGTWMSMADARLVRTTVGTNAAAYDLWTPTGSRVRVVADAVGLRSDNWLARSGSVTLWPSPVARHLSLRLTLPDARAAADTIHFTGATSASYTIQPLQTRTVSFLVPAGTRPWTVRWQCDRYGIRDGMPVSFLSAPPRITAAAGPLR